VTIHGQNVGHDTDTMVSGALGKISRLCPADYIKSITCSSLCRFALFLLSPHPWYPGQLPQSPAPQYATGHCHEYSLVVWDVCFIQNYVTTHRSGLNQMFNKFTSCF